MFKFAKSPEELGLSSASLLMYLDDVEKRGLRMHAVTVLRHGEVAAQFVWKPYRADEAHMLFSLSKSFTSCAAGFAVAEGLLRYEDRIIDILPDKAPENPSELLQKVTIAHLLMMGSGLAPESDSHAGDDWAREVLAQPVQFEPGTHFHYNSHGTYLVSAAVQRVAGMTVLDYLTPRLFQPLGIEKPHFDSCPEGVNCGGWGLHLSCESIAKFGQLLLQKGMWAGKRVLPAGWVETASSKHIENDGGSPDPDNEWAQGYGYQFWRARGGRFRGDGAFGQICMVDEARDMVVAATAGVSHMAGEMRAMADFIFPALEARPGTDAEQATLAARAANLSHPFPADSGEGPLPEGVYVRDDGKETLSFAFAPDGALRLTGESENGPTDALFGCGTPLESVAPPNPFTATVQPALGAWGREGGKLLITCRMPRAPFYLEAAYECTDTGLDAVVSTVQEKGAKLHYTKK
jgi:CubicO group peptidase (beta-lactamase class C family)